MSEESFVYSACPTGSYCGSCPLTTIVKDGKIVRTERTYFTGTEKDEGFICQKGIAAARYPYQPNRILHPLKRAGERGEGKWEEISWDQALDEIAAKMIEIRDQYGARAVASWTWPGGPGMGLNTLLPMRLGNVFGMSDTGQAIGVDNGPIFALAMDGGQGVILAAFDPNLMNHTNYIITWGCNPVENQPRVGRYIAQAQDRGVKVVDFGLVFDGTAGKAEEFFFVKPGTDAALALSMANVIVSENLHDRDYLLAHTVAPFLVRADDGLFLRDDDHNYLVWDETTGKAVSVAPHTPISAASPALTGNYEVDGVACSTAFQKLVEHLGEYTPEAQEPITGVSADVVRRIAREYASAQPAMIYTALGLRYQNAGRTYRAIFLLAELTGNLGRLGGGITGGGAPTNWPPVAVSNFPIVYPDGPENSKGTLLKAADFFTAVKTGDPYPVKALFKTGGNPVHNYPGRGRWINDVFPYLDLIVDYDIWMTDTGEYADYVLPDTTTLERTELLSGYKHLILQEPAIEPQGESKPVADFMRELAMRLGVGEYFDKTTEEWIEEQLSSEDPSVAGITPPVTLERLKAEKMIRANVHEGPVDLLGVLLQEGGLPSPSGRLEFYKEELADLGEAVAKYVPTWETGNDEKRKATPYQFFTGRQRFFMQSFFNDDPLLVKLSGGKPSASMNPADAEREGIHDGDLVECFNDKGRMQTVMYLDGSVPPGTVHMWYGWRKRHYDVGMYSDLLPDLVTPETIDALADRQWEIAQEVPSVGPFIFGYDSGTGGAWDTIWDALCNVRKVADAKGGAR